VGQLRTRRSAHRVGPRHADRDQIADPAIPDPADPPQRRGRPLRRPSHRHRLQPDGSGSG
jgi:hypothetical protein